MVIGVSAGAGKSTLARRLGEELEIEVIHLDRLYWRPGWVESPLDEFRASQQENVQKEKWIIEGNYSNSFDIRAEKADTIVYIELPLSICLYRVVKRWITNIGKNRPDMADGCAEKLDWKFIKFIVKTYNQRKKTMAERIEAFRKKKKKVYILKSEKEVRSFTMRLKIEMQN